MIGAQVGKNDFNIQIGNIASWLNEYYNQSKEIKGFIETNGGVTGLVAMGFTQDEAATIETAFNDLAYQKDTAFDSSQAVKKLYGTGIK